MAKSRVYDMNFNWRAANYSLKNPTRKPSELTDDRPVSDLMLFLPASLITDLRALRDWLHDTDTVGGSYSMYGRFVHERSKFQSIVTFQGIVFLFRRVQDIMYFKLRWGGQALACAEERVAA